MRRILHFFKSRNCAFVNFTNIANAIKAIDGVKNKPEYTTLRIAHGKDRCANPPRSGPQGGGGKRSGNGNGPPSAEPLSAIGDGENGELTAQEAALLAEEETKEALDLANLPEQAMHVDAVANA